jgi:hypothetical protein
MRSRSYRASCHRSTPGHADAHAPCSLARVLREPWREQRRRGVGACLRSNRLEEARGDLATDPLARQSALSGHSGQPRSRARSAPGRSRHPGPARVNKGSRSPCGQRPGRRIAVELSPMDGQPCGSSSAVSGSLSHCGQKGCRIRLHSTLCRLRCGVTEVTESRVIVLLITLSRCATDGASSESYTTQQQPAVIAPMRGCKERMAG